MAESNREHETKEVPLPKDVTIRGGRRTQNAGDQLLMLAFGGALLVIGFAGLVPESRSFLLVVGAFAIGIAFERLQWMLMADYGSWRAAFSSMVRGALARVGR